MQKRKKTPFTKPIFIFMLTLCLSGGWFTSPGRLWAEILSEQVISHFSIDADPFILSDEELAALATDDSACPYDPCDGQCSRFLINDSDGLIRLPSLKEKGLLLVPLQHLVHITGGSLSFPETGQAILSKDGQEYQLETGSPWLICGERIWTLPVQPIEEYGYIYVPLRFFCDLLDVDVQWHSQSGTVLLDTPQIDHQQALLALTLENQVFQDTIEKAAQPDLGEPIEVVVTFYFDSAQWGNWTASGARATIGSIAADPAIPFGSQYYIPELSFLREDGIFTVEDRGGAVRGNVIDVYLPNPNRSDPLTSQAFRLGKHTTIAYPLLPKE